MSNIYLGMDVHQDSITVAVLPAQAPAPTRVDRVPNDLPKLRRYLDRLATEGTLKVCYESSGAGYVLHRAVTEWGCACVVIAPSLDRHLAMVLQVLGQIDCGHAAGAKLALDPVAVGEGSGQALEAFGQTRSSRWGVPQAYGRPGTGASNPRRTGWETRQPASRTAFPPSTPLDATLPLTPPATTRC